MLSSHFNFDYNVDVKDEGIISVNKFKRLYANIGISLGNEIPFLKDSQNDISDMKYLKF